MKTATKKTKQDLIDENERLGRELERAIEANRRALAALAASGSSVIRFCGQSYVAVVLTEDQRRACRDTIEDAMLRDHGNGDRLSRTEDGYETWQTVVEPRDRLLPNIDHFLIRYGYTRDNGTDLHQFWGAVVVAG